jgi:hypothetical protein
LRATSAEIRDSEASAMLSVEPDQPVVRAVVERDVEHQRLEQLVPPERREETGRRLVAGVERP